MQEANPRRGIAAFLVMWAGQLLSLTGSSITRFALTLWAWEVSGQATVLATVALFSFGPSILIGPLAGALVDRWPRKAVLIGADVAAALVTAMLLILHLSDALAIWHLYLAGVLQGIAEAFQSPAYTASITLMVPEKHYERASGLTSFARSARDIGGADSGGDAAAADGVARRVLDRPCDVRGGGDHVSDDSRTAARSTRR